MPEFAGIVSTLGQRVEPRSKEAVRRLLGPSCREYDENNVWIAQAGGAGHEDDSINPPTLTRQGSLFLAAHLRLDNEHEVRRHLGSEKNRSAMDLAVTAYAADPEGFPSRLLGAFSGIVYDRSTHTVVCFRDHFGVRPLFYTFADGLFACSSDIRCLTALGPRYRDLDSRRIAEFLEGAPTSVDRTFYTVIKRLPPASRLTASGQSLHVSQYWSAEDIPVGDDRRDESGLLEEFRNLFFQSVECRVESGKSVGCLLSGGLDSSSVACVAREVMDPSSPLTTFSAVFPGFDEPLRSVIDESMFIDSVCEIEGITSVRLEADRLTPFSRLDEMLAAHGQPFDPPNAYLDAAMSGLAAEHEMDILLDGLEGDVTISHGVHLLDELAARGDWSSFLGEAGMLEGRLQLKADALFRTYGLEHVRVSGPSAVIRALASLVRAGRPDLAARALRARFGADRRPQSRRRTTPRIISKELADSVGWDVTEVQPEAAVFPSERAAHIAFLEKAYIPSIMEFTHVNGRHAGIEVRHPMFDKRLVEFAVGLPPRMKLRDGWTRYILRASMSGIVPDTVRWRVGKATLAPNFDLKLANESRRHCEELLRDQEPDLRNFAEIEVLWLLLNEGHYRSLWPALVLASFLKKDF